MTFTNHSADLFYSWAEQQDAPLNLLATDRGQISASVLVIGGAAACWIASQVHTVISWPWVTWLSVVSIPFAGLAMFYGFMMRVTRRSRLRDPLRAEYVGAVNALQ